MALECQHAFLNVAGIMKDVVWISVWSPAVLIINPDPLLAQIQFTNCTNSCQYHLTVYLTRSKFRKRAIIALYIIIIIMLFNRNLPIRCHKTSLRAFISVCVLKSGSNIEAGNVRRYPAKSIIALVYLRKYIISKRFKIWSNFLLRQVF